jgi:hypothetical protein
MHDDRNTEPAIPVISETRPILRGRVEPEPPVYRLPFDTEPDHGPLPEDVTCSTVPNTPMEEDRRAAIPLAVWLRAAQLPPPHLRGEAHPLHAGDVALAALLRAHERVGREGVFAAAKTAGEAREAYRFFGFHDVCSLFEDARVIVWTSPDVRGEEEERFNARYRRCIPDEEIIKARFSRHFAEHPECYAPIW